MQALRTTVLFLMMVCLATAAWAAPIPEELREAVARGGQAEFFVVLAEQADLSGADRLETKSEKGRYVFQALTSMAERTQAGILSLLSERNTSHKSFWIQNMVLVTGDQALLEEMSTRLDVSALRLNKTHQVLDPDTWKDAYPAPAGRTIEWSLQQINADQVWDELGITGEGIVVMDADTGVDWDHPALINQYRGWNGVSADHNYNWFDATGSYPNAPGDGHGHGTHTTGTMVGDDGGSNQIGVAPGAKWIACKNMTDSGSGDDDTFHTAFQFGLAPTDLTGNNPNPDLAPHVINNSWGYWGGNDPVFQPDLTALVAAGVVVEVSSGNEGSSCSSLRSPGDYDTSFTTGATVSGGGIWSYSSRGPSALTSMHKPDVSAPGDNIRSSVPGGGYEGGWSGTSMAGPHTCGLVALLLSADDDLIGDVAATRQIIEDSAMFTSSTLCSSQAGEPNNVYGHGEIDCYAAVFPHVGPSSAGELELGADLFGCSHDVMITVEDSDLEGNGTHPVTVVSDTESTPETVVLTEGDPGEFHGSIMTAEGAPGADGILQVTHGDQITVTYDDADHGGAGPMTLTADAQVDCQAPMISSVTVQTVTSDSALIRWNTDEPALSRVHYGTTPPPADTEEVTSLSTSHEVLVEGLDDCTYHYFSVESEDEAGNPAMDDNGGLYYGFMTWELALMMDEDMSSDPGWTTEGQWAWGSPTGGGGEHGSSDPSSGYTGSSVYGYNLNGDYADSMSEMNLTTSAIDCSAVSGVTLTYHRWLGVERNTYDHAYLRISTNGGSSWTNVWQNGDDSLDGGAWEERSYDLSAWADGESDVRLRWTMGSTDTGWTYCGWNIDDVRIFSESECSEPTPTPPPTFTPTVTPTATTPPTETPEPTMTPEPEPTATATPVMDFGVILELPSYVSPGETFYILGHLMNSGAPRTNVPTFFVLDVAGDYYFWPSWVHYDPPGHAEFDYAQTNVPTGGIEVPVLPSFPWPDTGSDSMMGIGVIGAMLNENMTAVEGEMALQSFGFGPAR